MYQNIRKAVQTAVASNKAVPADFNAEAFMADTRDDIEDSLLAQQLLAKLTFIQENAEGASPALLVEATNEATSVLPELHLDHTSMESYDITMEGIGDIVTAVREYIVDKFKKIGDKIKKFFKGVAYVFKGMEARLDELEARLDDDKYKLTEEDVTIPVNLISAMVSHGKLLTLMDGWKNIGDYTDRFIDGAPVDKALKTLTSKRWEHMGDGYELIAKAMNDLIKDMSATEAEAKRVIVSTPRDMKVFSPTCELPHDAVVIIQTQTKSSEDGKAEYLLPAGTSLFTTTAKAAKKTKVTTMPPVSREEYVELIKVARANLGSMSKAVQSLEKMYHAEDDYIGALFSNDPSSKLSKQELNTLLTHAHHIYVTAYNLGFYGASMVQRYVGDTETMLKACLK